jgi:hypothetical protein
MAEEGFQQIPPDPVLQAAPEAAQEASSDSSEAEAASAVKGRRVMREWELIGSFDPKSENAEYIQSELERIATEKMAAGGIVKLAYLKHSDTDLGQWKVKDVFASAESGSKITRYRCPLLVRCKCQALLKVVQSATLVQIFMSQMHDPESHAVDKSKYLNWKHKNEVKEHIRVNPTASAAQMRRNLHRTSPEKKIDSQHVRFVSFAIFILCLGVQNSLTYFIFQKRPALGSGDST